MNQQIVDTVDFSDPSSNSNDDDWLFELDDDARHDLDNDETSSIAESVISNTAISRKRTRKPKPLSTVTDKLRKATTRHSQLFKSKKLVIEIPTNRFEYNRNELYDICQQIYLAYFQNKTFPNTSIHLANQFIELCNKTRQIMKSSLLDQPVQELLIFRFITFQRHEFANLVRFVRVKYLQVTDKTCFKTFEPLKLNIVKGLSVLNAQMMYLKSYKKALNIHRKCAVFMFNAFIRFIEI